MRMAHTDDQAFIRGDRVIKLSSPNMNNVISVGCSIGYISVVIFGLDGRQLDSDALGAVCHVSGFPV